MSSLTRELASFKELPLYLVPFDSEQVYSYSELNGVVTFVKVLARSFNQVSLIKCNVETGEPLTGVKSIILPINQFIEKMAFNEIDQVFRKFIIDNMGNIADVRIDKSDTDKVLVNILNNYGDPIIDMIPILMSIFEVKERLLRCAFNTML